MGEGIPEFVVIFGKVDPELAYHFFRHHLRNFTPGRKWVFLHILVFRLWTLDLGENPSQERSVSATGTEETFNPEGCDLGGSGPLPKGQISLRCLRKIFLTYLCFFNNFPKFSFLADWGNKNLGLVPHRSIDHPDQPGGRGPGLEEEGSNPPPPAPATPGFVSNKPWGW